MMAESDAKVAPEVAAAPDSVAITVSDPAAAVSVDVGAEGGGEKACRICHLSPDAGDGGPELIELGCGCKDDLASAHRDCAEAWFKLRGNRYCEICGTIAANITGKESITFMEKWHEGRPPDGSNMNSSRRGGCWREHPFCNFLMACLVVAFVLPWLFRLNIF